MDPEELRNQAAEAEGAAERASDPAQREWLMSKATALRHEADRLERRLDAKPDLLTPKRPQG